MEGKWETHQFLRITQTTAQEIRKHAKVLISFQSEFGKMEKIQSAISESKRMKNRENLNKFEA